MARIEFHELTKRYGAGDCRGPPDLLTAPGAHHRLRRRQRRGQDHHHSDAARAHPSELGHRHHRRAALRRSCVTRSRSIGAMVDPNIFHPRRTGRNALRVIARAADIPESRVDHVLAVVGLTDAARRRAGGYSTGMRQRLALAAALLGDPDTLVLDEPANGLDPEGVHWLRGLIKSLAAEGRTVFVSSHLLAELAQTIDDVVIIAQGRLITHEPMADLLTRTHGASLEHVYLELTRSLYRQPHQGDIMRSLIAAELLKLRTTRMLAVCVGVVALFAAALPIFIGTVAGHAATRALGPSSMTDFLRAPAQLTGGAVLLVGLLAAAGEYRHRTILTARLAEPRTTRLLTAKLITLAAVGLVVGIAMEFVATGVGSDRARPAPHRDRAAGTRRTQAGRHPARRDRPARHSRRRDRRAATQHRGRGRGDARVGLHHRRHPADPHRPTTPDELAAQRRHPRDHQQPHRRRPTHTDRSRNHPARLHRCSTSRATAILDRTREI